MSLPKKILAANWMLSVLSLGAGYIAWSNINQSHESSRTYTVPVYFYNTQQDHLIDAPKTAQITIHGTRQRLNLLERNNELAAHIDAADLHIGDNRILLNNHALFLPKQYSVVHCSPSPLQITVHSPSSSEVIL